MQRAIKFDQGVVKNDFTKMENIEDIDAAEVEYVDNDGMNVEQNQEEVDPQKDLFPEAGRPSDDNQNKEGK